MVARVTISIPESLLERLDAEAREQGVARSELVQESLSAYLGKTAEQRAADARRERALQALEQMRHFEDGRSVRDDRPILEILREIRDTDDSAPLRGHETERE